MPRAARFRITAIADLLRQIAYAPEEARRRQMESCERLIAEIEPDGAYSEEFVMFRVTGYRPERTSSATLVGSALLADLGTFVLRLSESVPLSSEERDGGAVPLALLARRLRMSERSLQRWRSIGLVQHHIDFPKLGLRIGCFESALQGFRRRRPDLFGNERRPRLDREERGEIIEQARLLRDEGRRSLSAVAKELARRHGRAHETIRQLLLGHDARSTNPIFIERGPLDEHDRRLIERAWRFGVPVAKLAKRLGRSEPAVHRQLLVRKRERLASLRLRWVEFATFALLDSEQVILDAPAARTGLLRLGGQREALAVLKTIRAIPPRDDSGVVAMLAAMNFLRRRVAAAIPGLPVAPNVAFVDAVETDLRWVSSLRETLLAVALQTALRRVEALAGCGIERLPADEIRNVFAALVSMANEIVMRVDPSRGQRLERLVALESDKALARLHVAERRSRAIATHGPSAVAIDDPFQSLTPWQAWLDPPHAWRERLSALAEPHRSAVTMRHGLDGAAPRTLSAIAKALRTSRPNAGRLCAEGEGRMRWGREK